MEILKQPVLFKLSLLIGSVAAVAILTGLTGIDREALPEDAGGHRPLAAFPAQSGFPQSVHFNGTGSSAPAVGDVDRDGDYEIFIGDANGLVYGWDHQGNALSGFPIDTGANEIVADVALADVDDDNELEIIAGTSSCCGSGGAAKVYVWNPDGSLVPGWPKSTQWTSYAKSWNEISSVAAADVDGDEVDEVVAVTTNNAGNWSPYNTNPEPAYNAYVWEGNGTLVSGWPTRTGPPPAYDDRLPIYGLVAAGDFNGDEKADVIASRDYNIINAADGFDGSRMDGWPATDSSAYLLFWEPGGPWWGTYDTIEFGVAAPVLADLDKDGDTELISIGIRQVKNTSTKINSALMVINADGSRAAGWTYPAQGSGHYNNQSCEPYNIASIANIDADPELEIIASTNDGFIRAYNYNSNSPIWSFDYRNGQNMIAGEAVIGDIDGDDEMEIVFGTHHANFSDSVDGMVYALDKDGNVETDFPINVGKKGVCTAPALNDIDNDGDVELIVGTLHNTDQVKVYDLPGAYNPLKMPWPQGRHDAQRSGTFVPPEPDLSRSLFFSTGGGADIGQTARFSVTIRNGGGTEITDTLTATIQIPPQFDNIANIQLDPNVGSTSLNGNTLTWSGILDLKQVVTIGYDARVNVVSKQAVMHVMTTSHPTVDSITRTLLFITNPERSYLPIITKDGS